MFIYAGLCVVYNRLAPIDCCCLIFTDWLVVSQKASPFLTLCLLVFMRSFSTLFTPGVFKTPDSESELFLTLGLAAFTPNQGS